MGETVEPCTVRGNNGDLLLGKVWRSSRGGCGRLGGRVKATKDVGNTHGGARGTYEYAEDAKDAAGCAGYFRISASGHLRSIHTLLRRLPSKVRHNNPLTLSR